MKDQSSQTKKIPVEKKQIVKEIIKEIPVIQEII